MRTYTSKELSSRANSAILEEIVQLISLAFVDDPWTKWLFNAHPLESYHAALPAYIRATIRLSLLCDASFTVITDDELKTPLNLETDDTTTPKPPIRMPPKSTIRAVAVTIPPHGNATFDSTLAAIRSGALTLPFTCGFGTIFKLMTYFLPRLAKMHDEIFPEKATKYHNWHLFYLATHPGCQGQGLGKRILLELQDMVRESNRTETEKASGKGKKYSIAPFYLESSTVDSKRLYNRVGFEDQAELVYGEIKHDEAVNKTEAGTVLGGKVFGMKWIPS